MSDEGRNRDECLDPQLLAAFAEKKVKRSEIPAVLAHLDGCPKCMETLKAAMDLMEPKQSDWRWPALAAAIVVIAMAVPFVQRLRDPSARLVRLAPRAARIVEPRLSGAFAYAPYRGAQRSSAADSDAQRMKLIGVAGELVERAEKSSSVEAQHAAGIGLLLVEKPEDAVARLRDAAERSPSAADAWSDLAAAEYAAALRAGSASRYPVALAHVEHALRIDPNAPAALFNRALILERLGLTQAAHEAWEHYLRVDPSSRWAEEARARLRRLPRSTGESRFRHDQPRFESAVANGDASAVAAFVDRYRQQSRGWGEAEYLGRWGEAVLRGDAAAASRELAVARSIGDALARLSGEILLRDAVLAIDGATPVARDAIAEAHVAYRNARIAYSRREPAAAEPELRRVAALFTRGRDPMALVARYYAANTRYDRNDPEGARRELEVLRYEADALPHYRALGAQIRWELTLCAMLDDDWDAAALLAADASRTFRDLGEASNLAVMQTMLATALISLGRPDEGWALRIETFAMHNREGHGPHVPLSIGEAARMELRMGRVDVARALLGIEEAAHRAARDDVLLSAALVRLAVVDATADDAPEAHRSADEAMRAALRIADPALRSRAVADASFGAASAALSTDPRLARQLSSKAIDHYRATDKSFYLPEACLLRARASLRLGDRDAATRDLEDGIAAADRHRTAVAGAVVGTGVLDARRALFEELVAMRLDRGDVSGAFAAAEDARRRLSWSGERSSSSDAALRKKLAGSETTVLELVVLPRELVAFCVTESGTSVSRHAIGKSDMVSLAARPDAEAMRALYDVLIRPAEPFLARQLIIVADAELQHVAMAALFDSATNRHLVEKTAVAMASSASALEPAFRASANPAVVAIALPTGSGSGTVALPEVEAELADVRRLYRNALELRGADASLAAFASASAHADVVHVAGHTERSTSSGESALRFQGRAGVEPVTWSRIASMQLGRPIVVLAACETLRVPVSPRSLTLSLGGGFVAAGASAVIGTLTPVADAEARELFGAIHRELARGRGAVAALQRVQIEAIAADSDRRSEWRSLAVLTRQIERS